MAQKTSVAYFSDLSDVEITDNDQPTVSFGWDGNEYTIDLTSQEAEKFHKAIEPYLNAATKVSGGRSRSTAKRSTAANSSGRSSEDLTAIREWAKANGHEVADRGRIKKEILEAYDAAH